MSYFNEPTRLAMLKLMPEVKKMFDEPPKDNKPTGKGLLSRSVKSSGVGVRQAMGGYRNRKSKKLYGEYP